MVSKNLVICDSEEGYAQALAMYFMRKKELAAEVQVCSTVTQVMELEKTKKIHLLFLAGEYAKEAKGKLQEYVKLGALLSQNLRRGTRGLSQLLKIESVQAFEERKARAKRIGEEAGTKLLGPLFLMLAVVLFIVIVPAFMSMQM